ncbi:MAG: hypothetical protein JNK05_32090 [Myxococcales bacterium]|nr:hypothetical protein [Myxococcales bacterium]
MSAMVVGARSAKVFSKVASVLGAMMAVAMVAGCAPEGAIGDELDGEFGESAADEARADSFVLFRLRHDTRRCVSPLCGGVWVSRVNRSTTRCADGTYARECYAAEVDYTALGLDEAARSEFSSSASSGQAIVRARLRSKTFGSFGALGELVVTEGWKAMTDAAPTGPFYFAKDNGRVCIRTPCPHVDVSRLNYVGTTTIDGVSVSRIAGLSDSDVHNAYEQMGDVGVIVAGGIRSRALPSGSVERTIDATQVYLRVGQAVSEAQFCDRNDECTRTPYRATVTSASECFCPLCPTTVTNVSSAEANQRSWQRFCSRTSTSCPVVRCARPPEVACVNHACVNAPEF